VEENVVGGLEVYREGLRMLLADTDDANALRENKTAKPGRKRIRLKAINLITANTLTDGKNSVL
jgi:hypothetical protein